MKKRLFVCLVAAVFALTLLPHAALAAGSVEMGGTTYATIAEAIAAANGQPAEITVTASMAEDVVIPAGANVTLTLNAGVTLSNVSGHTIVNNGTLNVKGSGTVTAVVNNTQVLVNNGLAELSGGSFVRNDVVGSNVGYTVVNHGTLTITGTAAVSNSANFSSCVVNGWGSDAEIPAGGAAKLIVSGGSVSGGVHAIKNDLGGDLSITGGTITGHDNAPFAVLNYNKASISGGSIESKLNETRAAAVYNTSYDSANAQGSMEISAGTLTGNRAVRNDSTKAPVTISGGTLNGHSSAMECGTGTNTVITGGTFTAGEYYGLTTKGTVSIEGGEFNGGSKTSGYAVFTQRDSAVSITDGTFNAGPNSRYTISQDSTASTVEISGGTYTGGTRGNVNPASKTEPTMTVSGGSFSSSTNLDVVMPSGSEVTQVPGGGFEILPPVATVDGVGYRTLAEAIQNANGKTVTLMQNVSGQFSIPAGHTLTLELNGHTITNSAGLVALDNFGNTTIQDSVGGGGLVSTRNAAMRNNTNATLTVLSGNFKGREGALILGLATSGEVNLKGGTFTAEDNAVIHGNGTQREGTGTTVNISGGTYNGGIITPGYIACGVYMPWKDTLNITGGEFNITNGVGILTRGGKTSVTGGEFNITGTVNGYVGDAKISIPSAAVVFDSKANYPSTAGGNIEITGGSFSADGDVLAVLKPEGETEQRISVSGGSFSQIVDEEFCAEGFAPETEKDENGNYTVHVHTLTAVAAVQPSCAGNGQEGYWTCKNCGKLYSDAEGTTEITAPAVIPAAGHKYGGWSSDSNGHWRACTVCGTYVDSGNHILQWVVDKEATETEDGSRHQACSVCSRKQGETEVIPATGSSSSQGSSTTGDGTQDGTQGETPSGDSQPVIGPSDEDPGTQGGTQGETPSGGEEEKSGGFGWLWWLLLLLLLLIAAYLYYRYRRG